MNTVLAAVPPEMLEERRRLGLDRRDEMWDGVLHMAPAPKVEHARIGDRLIEFLNPLLRATGRGTLYSEINIFRSDANYRIPDLTFVAMSRASILHDDGVRGGGPDAVMEIRSPGDETYDKFPFFASIGTREIVVIDRDSKRPELFYLAGSDYITLDANDEGWLLSATMQVRFRRHDAGTAPQLAVEDALEPSARTLI